jgi:hypothetical protein
MKKFYDTIRTRPDDMEMKEAKKLFLEFQRIESPRSIPLILIPSNNKFITDYFKPNNGAGNVDRRK